MTENVFYTIMNITKRYTVTLFLRRERKNVLQELRKRNGSQCCLLRALRCHEGRGDEVLCQLRDRKSDGWFGLHEMRLFYRAASRRGRRTEIQSCGGIVGHFLGSLGIHNFYLGYKGKALAQLLITLCTCGMGSIVTSIWGLIEGVLILTGSIATDANGVPLKD